MRREREQQMLSSGSPGEFLMRPKLLAGFNNKQRTYTRFILFGEREIRLPICAHLIKRRRRLLCGYELCFQLLQFA